MIDQTSVTFSAFLGLMILHPAVAQAAQREIDAVVGSDRLPGFDDRLSLPYIDCILKEVLRYAVGTTTIITHLSRTAECTRQCLSVSSPTLDY